MGEFPQPAGPTSGFSRRGVICVITLAAVWAVAGVEMLSVFHAIGRTALIGWWGVGLILCAWRVRWSVVPPRLSWLEAVLAAGIGAVLGIVGWIAIVSPPNSTDAMGYHLPRVLYWAQAGSVEFFPVHYYPQLTMPPLAEYFILHTWVLSGGDRFANLVQWGAMAASMFVVSGIAGRLGASRWGQWMAAVLVVTLPNGILQASGVKNDYVLALWVVAAVYFALERGGGAWLGCAIGLAILTKGTALLFLAPLLIAVMAGRWLRWRGWVAAGVCALAINAPQLARNLVLSGHPLGFRTAHGDDGDRGFRWSPDSIGAGSVVSNVMRFSAEHLGARSERWNRGVYDAVVAAHRALGLDPDDPATSWRWAKFEPPRNSNHEVNAANRWHGLLLLLVPLAAWLPAGRRRWLIYWVGIASAYLLFCAMLRWQPFMIRMQLPLFVAGMPLVAVMLDRIAPRWVGLVLCLFLLNAARPYLFENWVRPLRGENSILRVPREDAYFNDMKQWGNRDLYRQAVDRVAASGCRAVGIDNSLYQLEYPLEALLRERAPEVRFLHTGVENLSAGYPQVPAIAPCAVVCFECAGVTAKERAYAGWGDPARIGNWLLWLRR